MNPAELSVSGQAAPAVRTLVMGIVNVTPDSFSDGGQFLSADAAIAHGLELIADGADIVDIGGESTRPGAQRPGVAEEMRRVLPVIAGLADAGVPLSIDTMNADVAQAAVEAGATIVNDVSGGGADPKMLPTMARLGVDYVCMHWRGYLDAADSLASYRDVVPEVLAELSERRNACLAAGISPERLILDPGFGFSKDPEQNWALLRSLEQFQNLGHRLLVGVSRKRFLGALLAGREPLGRDAASAALSFYSAERGVWAVRTHSVRPHRDAIAVASALAGAAPARN